MSSPEDKKTSQLPSSPIAKKHVNLNDSPVTPCPTKYARINHDDPFIDDRKPSSMSSPTSKTDYSQHTLIPVIAKMIHSAVSTFNFITNTRTTSQLMWKMGPELCSQF
jgi:hypothetical protein